VELFHNVDPLQSLWVQAKMSKKGTGIKELTRGLVTLPQRWTQEPLVVRDRDGRPQEDPLAVHCFCVYSGSALLEDLLGGKQVHGT